MFRHTTVYQITPVSRPTPASAAIPPTDCTATAALAGLADREAEGDTQRMKESLRNHEAGRISDTACILGYLRSMGMTMEDGEETDNSHCDRNRRLDIERDDRAEHDD